MRREVVGGRCPVRFGTPAAPRRWRRVAHGLAANSRSSSARFGGILSNLGTTGRLNPDPRVSGFLCDPDRGRAEASIGPCPRGDFGRSRVTPRRDCSSERRLGTAADDVENERSPGSGLSASRVGGVRSTITHERMSRSSGMSSSVRMLPMPGTCSVCRSMRRTLPDSRSVHSSRPRSLRRGSSRLSRLCRSPVCVSTRGSLSGCAESAPLRSRVRPLVLLRAPALDERCGSRLPLPVAALPGICARRVVVAPCLLDAVGSAAACSLMFAFAARCPDIAR